MGGQSVRKSGTWTMDEIAWRICGMRVKKNNVAFSCPAVMMQEKSCDECLSNSHSALSGIGNAVWCDIA